MDWQRGNPHDHTLMEVLKERMDIFEPLDVQFWFKRLCESRWYHGYAKSRHTVMVGYGVVERRCVLYPLFCYIDVDKSQVFHQAQLQWMDLSQTDLAVERFPDTRTNKSSHYRALTLIDKVMSGSNVRQAIWKYIVSVLRASQPRAGIRRSSLDMYDLRSELLSAMDRRTLTIKLADLISELLRWLAAIDALNSIWSTTISMHGNQDCHPWIPSVVPDSVLWIDSRARPNLRHTYDGGLASIEYFVKHVHSFITE